MANTLENTDVDFSFIKTGRRADHHRIRHYLTEEKNERNSSETKIQLNILTELT